MVQCLIILLLISTCGCARLGAGLSAAGNAELKDYPEVKFNDGVSGRTVVNDKGTVIGRVR